MKDKHILTTTHDSKIPNALQSRYDTEDFKDRSFARRFSPPTTGQSARPACYLSLQIPATAFSFNTNKEQLTIVSFRVIAEFELE